MGAAVPPKAQLACALGAAGFSSRGLRPGKSLFCAFPQYILLVILNYSTLVEQSLVSVFFFFFVSLKTYI